MYNLHVTLKFIGEWPEEKLPQLEAALRSVAPRQPIPAEVKGLGWFPNPHHPRVFWVGVHGGDALPALVKDIDTATRAVGHRGGGSGIQCAFDAGAHQGASAAAGSAERDRSARIRRIRRVRQWTGFICTAASRGRPAPSIQNFRSIPSEAPSQS